MVEEMFEAGVVSQRKAALPFRRCYDLNYHVRTRATHRDIDFAAEAGPEVGVPSAPQRHHLCFCALDTVGRAHTDKDCIRVSC
jgi:hypothetical protein